MDPTLKGLIAVDFCYRSKIFVSFTLEFLEVQKQVSQSKISSYIKIYLTLNNFTTENYQKMNIEFLRNNNECCISKYRRISIIQYKYYLLFFSLKIKQR